VTSRNNRRGAAKGVLCGSATRLYDSTEFSSDSEWSLVEGAAVECQPADNESGRLSIAKIRYQETSSEDIAEEQSLLKAVTK
jgi:hypothetical protein